MVRSTPSLVFDDSALVFVGTHRIQRVPATEKKGRRHTSFVHVHQVVTTNNLIRLDKSDIRVDTFRGSGNGGQHRNKTDSAVRITHIPTGTVVTATEDRSQHRNRVVALERLRTKLDGGTVDNYDLADVRWEWCDWRDEVVLPDGTKKSMSRVLKKGV